MQCIHEDVIRWKHFPRYWPCVRGIHRSPVNSPHKGQWRGALMFSLICAWINSWVNNREAGDLRRHSTHYDVSVMIILDHTGTYIYRLNCNTAYMYFHWFDNYSFNHCKFVHCLHTPPTESVASHEGQIVYLVIAVKFRTSRYRKFAEYSTQTHTHIYIYIFTWKISIYGEEMSTKTFPECCVH